MHGSLYGRVDPPSEQNLEINLIITPRQGGKCFWKRFILADHIWIIVQFESTLFANTSPPTRLNMKDNKNKFALIFDTITLLQSHNLAAKHQSKSKL